MESSILPSIALPTPVRATVARSGQRSRKPAGRLAEGAIAPAPLILVAAPVRRATRSDSEATKAKIKGAGGSRATVAHSFYAIA
jgi:hypothetical protein